jgi:hypothetical protein
MLPSEVYLVHPREFLAYECQVAWRQDASVGLRFVGSHDLEGDVGDDLMVLNQLCVEHALRSAPLAT